MLKFIQPPEKCGLVFAFFLGCLVDRIGGGVPSGKDQTAVFVPLAPDLLVGSITVNGIESGGCVGIYIRRVASKFTAELHFDQCGTGFCVLRKFQLTECMAFLLQPPGQKLELGGFAGSVGSFNYD